MYLAWLGNKASVKQKMQLLRNLLYHFSEDEVRWKEKHRHRKGVCVCVRTYVCVLLGEEHKFSVFSGLVSFFKVLQYVLLLLCLTVVVVALTVQLQQQMLQTVIQKP